MSTEQIILIFIKKQSFSRQFQLPKIGISEDKIQSFTIYQAINLETTRIRNCV